ncbi:MAG: DegT/DnrJ/EryC1/StrS family aminotransferase [Bacteroidetes bacterium]|nr:DegT/DnrJ/EryC1/StrS family aminotransferase [Bacteroidota bacterium]
MGQQINQYEPSYSREEIDAVNSYLNSGAWLTEFRKTRELEEMMCAFTGAKYCAAIANGTVSLFVMLKAVGIGHGDEVIVPDLTMAATPNAVVLAGATPVFADIDEKNLCLDVEQVEKAITKKTKAVIHVSFNGRAGKLEELKKLCRVKKIYLFEDAAQSLGSFYNGKHLGTIGTIGSFSLSMPKIITTGQGGFLITDNPSLYKKIKLLKDFGRRKGGEDFYKVIGWNFKFTDLQAVFGIEQFKKLPERMAFKKRIYAQYKNLLADIPQVEFFETDLSSVSPWFIDIMVPQRDKLMKHLHSNAIISRPVYPALHTQPAYKKSPLVKIRGKFPASEKISRRVLWLPSSFSLTEENIEIVCKSIKEFFQIPK